jgi:transposase
MKRYTSENERRRFYELHEKGQTYEEIAEAFGVSKECVRMWCRRMRAGGTTQDRYYNPREGVLSQFTPGVREKILELRKAHRRWGPVSIHLHLQKETSLAGQKLPSRASIGRYLHSFAEFRHTPKKRVG